VTAQTIKSWARVGVYPALMIGALAMLWALINAGLPLTWAPYAVVVSVGSLVLLSEYIIPYRRDWRPFASDFARDGLFMSLTQMAVPFAMMWLVTLLLQSAFAQSGWRFNVWPVAWPIAAQLVLKVIAGDFLRYWLHRAAHTWLPLWRLHEVHHHPEKLYTTNVFRFHPLEKSLQFLLDTLPFIILGAGPELLAYYFVFYSISGLFQHSNIDVRLGWLNFIVSGPEVHRWHHSKLIAESNSNYAHSFVVWDLVFGTYFRPRDRRVERLGLLDPKYPTSFLGQMAAPFRVTRHEDT
jgi:ornithine lipid hydroxylase